MQTQTIVTHDNNFHSDDVLAVAALQIHYGVENVNIIRSRDKEDIERADIVVDVGGIYDTATKRFDHHQPGAPVRENGIPYAAFGLVWKQYGPAITGSDVIADTIDQKLAQPVDAGDNGTALYTLNDYNVRPFEFYNVIASFRPFSTIPDDILDAFLEAVAFARALLERMISYEKASEEIRERAHALYEASTITDGVLVIDEPISTAFFSDYPDVAVVVRPGDTEDEAQWIAKAVPVPDQIFVYRRSFPATWSGLRGKELAQASGIDDAVFCHADLFVFISESRQGAEAAAHAAIENPETNQ